MSTRGRASASDSNKAPPAAKVTASKATKSQNKKRKTASERSNSDDESTDNDKVVKQKVKVAKDSNSLNLLIYSTAKKYDGQLYLSADTSKKGHSKVCIICNS